ncbi:MAG TPA: amino acid adenylation domain-containing protein [Bacillota bacterium]|nr:amino acid adenylation domain-containing protein [Bacillota bacterium]
MKNTSDNLNQLSEKQRAYLMQRLLEKGTDRENSPNGTGSPKILQYPRDGKTPSFPLSFGQERIWLLNRLESGSPAYNMTSGFKITGALKLDLIQPAVQLLVEQHEILRTVFKEEDGQPLQIIQNSMTIPIETVNLLQTERNQLEQAIDAIASGEKARLFDLTQGPLLRLKVVVLGPTEHILLVQMHHIITDAYSLRLFIRQLFDNYHGLSQGQTLAPASLPIQYADYAAWQRETVSAEKLETLTNFWRNKLEGANFSLDMPLDFSRPPVQTFEGSFYRFEFDEDLSQKLLDHQGTKSCSLFIKLLTLFNILLYRYSGQSDILIGSPVWNRYYKEMEGLIGFFVNTLVLRNIVEDGLSFQALLEQVTDSTLETYQHQDMPFELLVKTVNLERDLSRNPLFQISLNVVNQPFEKIEYDDLQVESHILSHHSSLFDLTLNVRNRNNKLLLWFEYNKALFRERTIERLARYFERLTMDALQKPELPISQLELIPPEEKSLLLDEWNRNDQDYPLQCCLPELFTAQAVRLSRADAVISKDQKLSYAELEAQSNQFAHYLQSLSIQTGSAVGVYMEKTVATVVALLGIIKCGAYYIPLDPSYPAERLAYIVEDSGVKVVVCSHSNQTAFKNVSYVVWETDIETIKNMPARAVEGICPPESIAYCIYTSGSTGKPKGVLVPHRALVNFLYAMQEFPFIKEKQRLLSVTPLSFDISILELFLPLVTGAATVIVPQSVASDPAALMTAIGEYQPHIMQATPATWQMLLEAGFKGDQRMVLLCGGEALSRELANRLLDVGSALWNMYGPTETTIWSCVHRVTAEEISAIPIGRPISNTEIYIIDDNLKPVPIGAVGNLYIGGKGLAQGYRNLDELTQQRFIPHPFKAQAGARIYNTGDLARYRPDGVIEYYGRSDFQVKVRGFRIELGEIETVLQRHPEVNQAVVIVHGDRTENQIMVAYLKMKENSKVSDADFRSFLEHTLPAYMVPNHFIAIDSFPLTPSGKTDRRVLERRKVDNQIKQVEYVAPADEVEEILVDIWRSLLKKEKIGVLDNFFSLGGHSLLAVKTASRIRDSFEIELPLRVLFQNPTIKALALQINTILLEELAQIDDEEALALLNKPN